MNKLIVIILYIIEVQSGLFVKDDHNQIYEKDLIIIITRFNYYFIIF